MLAATLIAAASAVCPDGSEPFTEPFFAFTHSTCSTTSITDAASVTKDTLCAPHQLGFSCCVARFETEDGVVQDYWCYDDNDIASLGSSFQERCTAEDTEILNHTTHEGLYFIFNCQAPPPPETGGKLSSGAIGGIVVGAYLGVAGAVGAFGVYRGYAAV